MRRRSAEKTAELSAYVEDTILTLKKRAVKRLRAMQEEDVRLWEERTVADVTTLKVLDVISAENRAKANAAAGPKVLGVVLLPQRIESATDWEAQHQRIEADERAKRAIDAVAVPVKAEGNE